MYITNDKVFLHMVKSAGISVHVGLFSSNNKINFNMRHIGIDTMPDRYRELPRYGVIRKPEDWYKSFYKFFLKTHGYVSFLLNDLKDDGYIHPIEFNEFVRRSINFKDTLVKYPNKARVFNNILRSQGNTHFITTYFKTYIDPDDISTLDQFDMSLYEWFYNGCGMDTSINIPMDKLEDVEKLFDIKIGHENKTKTEQVDAIYDKEVLELVRISHKKFYDEIDNYKGL